MKTTLPVWGGVGLPLAGAVLIVQGSGDRGESPLGAQQPVTLGEAEAVYEESFSTVSTVRELPDGRVLVADALGQVLVRLDLDAGTADTLGRVGEGPEEYRQPDAAWALPGGKTLLVDLGNGRLTELSPELEFGDTRPYAIGELGPGRELVLAIPQAVDGRGRLYFRSFGRMGGGELASDSAYILRLDLESELVDSVGRIKLAETTTRTTGSGNNQNTSVSPIPLSAADAWGVAADGRVVIVRSGDYRVDWIGSDGDVVSGPAVAYEAVRIGRGKREEWAHTRSETGGGLGISMSVVNNSMTLTAGRGGTSDDDDLDQYEWPDFAPAFYGRPVPVDGGGRAWVRRHLEAGEAPRYDVFDGAGEREMVVRLRPERRVVSFGDGKVYVVRMDEYGLQYLERYALP